MVVWGYNTGLSILEYCHWKKNWFCKFYSIKKTPSYSTISSLLCVLEKKKFAQCFITWVNGIYRIEFRGSSPPSSPLGIKHVESQREQIDATFRQCFSHHKPALHGEATGG